MCDDAVRHGTTKGGKGEEKGGFAGNRKKKKKKGRLKPLIPSRQDCGVLSGSFRLRKVRRCWELLVRGRKAKIDTVIHYYLKITKLFLVLKLSHCDVDYSG